MEALVEEVAFELRFYRLLGLRHAESRAGKDLLGRRRAEGDSLGVPALAGRRVMSSMCWLPQGALDCEHPFFFAKTQEWFRGSGISATLSSAWQPGCQGLLRPQTCLILQGCLLS